MRGSATRSMIIGLVVFAGACSDRLSTEAGPPVMVSRPSMLVDGPLTPVDGGSVTTTVVTIADLGAASSGQPRVSGDLACYAAGGVVNSYRFSTAMSAPVENPAPDTDFECAVDGNRVGFIHGGSAPFVGVFDAGTSVLTKFFQQLNVGIAPRQAAIGSTTVAFVELQPGVFATKIRVADTGTPGASIVVADAGTLDESPNVSPNGNVIVWERFEPGSPSSAWKALRDPISGTWSAPQTVISNGTDPAPSPDTDGSYIVWRGPSIGAETDLFVQSVGGGPITRVVIPGYDAEPRIDAGVVVFRHVESNGANPQILAYVIATNTLFHVSNEQVFRTNARDLDVSVLPNGDARLISESPNETVTANIISARTFSLRTSPPPPTFSFGGFQKPFESAVATVSAPSVVTVKFSLGGNYGLSVFVPGAPTTAPADCASRAPLGGAVSTVAQVPLTYDASTGTYMYKWKTDVAWRGTCRTLNLSFVDGTTATATVRFK